MATNYDTASGRGSMPSQGNMTTEQYELLYGKPSSVWQGKGKAPNFRIGGPTSASVRGAVTPSQIAKAIGMDLNAANQLNQAIVANQDAQARQATGANQSGYVPSATVGGGSGGNSASSPEGITNEFGLSALANSQNYVPAATTGAANTPKVGTDPVDWTFGPNGPAYSERDLETMLNDPYDFQSEFLKSIGQNTPGVRSAMGQYASRMNPLSIALFGGNQNPNNTDLESLAGMYQSLIQNYMTPGGRMPDFNEIMANLFAQPNIGNDGTAQNALQNFILSGAPQEQVQNVNSILGAALAGAPGAWGNAFASMLDEAGQAYLGSTKDAYGGIGNTYVDYFRNNPFWRAQGQ